MCFRLQISFKSVYKSGSSLMHRRWSMLCMGNHTFSNGDAGSGYHISAANSSNDGFVWREKKVPLTTDGLHGGKKKRMLQCFHVFTRLTAKWKSIFLFTLHAMTEKPSPSPSYSRLFQQHSKAPTHAHDESLRNPHTAIIDKLFSHSGNVGLYLQRHSVGLKSSMKSAYTLSRCLHLPLLL